MNPPAPEGHVVGMYTSRGGVPKLSVPSCDVRGDGIEGDLQRDQQHHGGPQRAVCLLAQETVTDLQREGHPIAPGMTGENLLVHGVGRAFPPGTRLHFDGGVQLEVTTPAAPCSNIRAAFADQDPRHLSADRDPQRARYYARVITPGRLVAGAKVQRIPAPDPA